ncbi:NAD(P)-dependent oxidoreductase [Salegentibacter sp. F188]|uniref:NAD(P)-dependent oxidoreductase n=1 Tax=Autumnicola patrickiae TaxID=3075591 RepID=A0ABU3E091_9FLAO|nr:NAD(P)-dependent oxidoreductase [Salegentibacter sp. F188]MDT0689084.1 NAD(P)-dependent oxidoreductase [Salegentibacter sp. F188]
MDMIKEKIGVIGLGRIGFPVARAFIKKGYSVYGDDKRSEIIEKFQELGGIHYQSPAEIGSYCKTVLVIVLNDKQVLEVFSGDSGLLEGIKPGSVIICMSTINRSVLESIAAQCTERNVNFVDCPFTGGPARVPEGNLTLIAAAPLELINTVAPVLEVIGNVVHVGNIPGIGQSVKYCNQLLVGTTHVATMEVITLARKLNLDAALVCKIVGSGIAGSEYFQLLSESLLEARPSPGGLGQMCKDMSIVSNTLDEVKFPAYVAKAATKYFKLAEDLSMQNLEGSELIKVVENVSDQIK